ncbi:GrpE protein [Gloeomargarita lithophora Alchichica-D10]|uniref:Protein GrpE n=1 Tax=Gloeomargarita lithophora Alchichica-D10 TaxID=1188229 RepID=A0A1J0AC21_9CYAN|nr:nucleotide exchange factor GrpE [Gloeomargarita lithophora]APB33500.1 GrpE protein [Gloeomargarita lithophora Alchichica-D10]
MINTGAHPEDLIPDPFAEETAAPETVAPPSASPAIEPETAIPAPADAPENAPTLVDMELPATFGELAMPEEPNPAAIVALQEELLQERERCETLRAEQQALEQKLAQAEQQSEDQRGQIVRLAADFENYRRRVQREQEEASLKAKAKVLEELLAVVDNFERARTHIRPETEEGMAIHKNYQGVYKQMVEELKKLGVAPIPGKGQPFDPNRHEAVLQEASREYAEGVVIEELRRGYFLKVGEEDRVLRHALVKVSTGAADAPELETTD